MYRILLVDDEARQLRALTGIIQNLRPDYEIHTATDGSEAWSLAESGGFDVIISDIRMPIMDGLQLLELVTGLATPPKFVLLSGYGEFKYAQQAIKLGIFDYIVKPIGKNEIEQLLNKIDSVLEQEQLEMKQLGEFARSLPAFREKQLLDWLKGHSDSTEIRAYMTGEVQSDLGFVMVTQLNPIQHSNSQIQRLLLQRLHEVTNDKLAPLDPEIMCSYEDNGLVVSLIVCRNLAFGIWRRALEQLQSTYHEIGVENQLTLSIGTSLPSSNIWNDGPIAYRQAFLALEKCFFIGAGQLVVFDKSFEHPGEDFELFESEQIFTEAIMKGQAENVYVWLNQWFDQMKNNMFLKPSQIKNGVKKLIHDRLKEAKQLASEEEYNALKESIHDKLTFCNDYRALRHDVKNIAFQIMEIFQRSNKDKNGVIIQKCKDYIHENYTEELFLEHIAQMFHFNPSYFSTLFKSVSGQSISEYIIQVRIEKARQLLVDTNDKISDVARKVGYKDSGYFIRVFNRQMGISPKKYRTLSGKG